ncbi:Hypothetical predicted protein [Mytilus galloprovincialis]|uniref:Testicular haploid expressed gene protein-like n=1 Tax=Mytilus galloprovincialis TaxID=29158 RepID=A0A8B6EDU5_MYTGA|nr:Hypothetical predicted protein [Mytilus galloprovincialis]
MLKNINIRHGGSMLHLRWEVSRAGAVIKLLAIAARLHLVYILEKEKGLWLILRRKLIAQLANDYRWGAITEWLRLSQTMCGGLNQEISIEKEERRIETLAKPKRVPSEFQDDRRSVYWIESNPPTPGPNGVTVIVATKRVSELAQHRVPHQYKHDRPSPIWPVRQTALEQEASERINQLSMHKNAHPQHAYDRTAYIEVSPGAKRAASTERIEMLSRPKMRQDRFGMDETEWGQYFPVSDAAKKATASGRIESLAESKRYHAMFQNEKPVQWPVDDGAMKAIASLEIQKLARPRSRTMIKDDYDPYKVPMAARRARATPRLDELCVPLPRKTRAKKA